MKRTTPTLPLGFEHKRQPLLSGAAFRLRMLRVGGAAAALIALALGVGALGYRVTEGLAWLDAALNAAMILTGMGPVDELHTQAGKLFAIAYALFSGVTFLSGIALILAPIAHRLLHAFHLEEEELAERGGPDAAGRH
jgi:hypothetical protein